ncbi:hypothetical protein LZK98_18855 [Sphingomonas cannabina]|uniref:DUF6644 family protein n=1 Tax=Sphingomonas cannabina TaxID=2899123 RepID=UPI001F20ABE3|nr:DUF6644 family protein [Sphingomonas cannabina]UIJ45081.1 hypothetical protein LZK98_18855 [Sphingomonas cannabina]
MLENFAASIEASAFGMAARESAWLYPAANLVHLLGLVCLVGGIGVVDLRLVGAFRTLPLATLSRALTPIAIAGLLMLAASGPVLFAADATALIRSPRFLTKLTLIAVALANALAFRFWWRAGETPSWPLRMLAGASLLLWLTVAALGRLIAYA